MAIQVGKTAPAFTLTNQAGEKVSLKDFRGKHVVLYFYPRDNTPGCTKEACGFRDFNREIEALDAVILGVSPDSVESHRKFIDKYSLNFDLLSDPDRKVMTRYGAFCEKKMYGKTVLGADRSTFLIDPEGTIRRIWRKVKVAGHADEVLEALKEARKG